MSNLEQAINEFANRKSRRSHPDGSFDKRMRWYPSESEACACCAGIRQPSGAYPYSLMLHCRTAVHLAAKYGVTALEIKRGAKASQA